MEVAPINRLKIKDIGMNMYAAIYGIMNDRRSITKQRAATQINARHIGKKLLANAIIGPANSVF